jgi:D-arabinose 1-dehydrogenase-like Zn-dependent alcohol dehydrogenase
MIKAVGYAAKSAHDKLHPFQFERDEPKAGEVVIEVLYCGVCHSDVHQVKNEWKNTVYPCLPGHEIVGRVARIGAGAIKVQEGDIVGVGCMIDSCRTCEACQMGEGSDDPAVGAQGLAVDPGAVRAGQEGDRRRRCPRAGPGVPAAPAWSGGR